MRRKKPSNKKEEEQLDWQKALPTMILPEKDYATFDEMELEARRIMKAAETKGIFNSEDTNKTSRPRRKKRTRDTRSSDLRLVNSDGQTATFFDVDSCSLKTDEMFQ